MTPFGYVVRSVLHHRFAYAGVLAGAVLGATVLLGALFAGDSVAASLRRISEQRIGRATHVVSAGDRFFRAALADELAATARVRTAPVMFLRGTAAPATSRAVVNQVQLVGVTDAFWQLAPKPATVALSAGAATVAINDTLARRLALAVGDTVIVRLHKPGILAGNAPVAGAESALQSLRGKVAAIVGDDAFGRFGLEATQVPSPSVFIPLELLQESLARPGRANLMLVDTGGRDVDLAGEVTRAMTLADYGLALKWREPAAAFDVVSDRIFVDPAMADAVAKAVPAAQPIVSYLVNELRRGERSTPYSIATATTPAAAPFLPADLGAREIVLNDWLADDLQAKPGDDVRLTYFQVGANDALVEQDATFRVRSIVPLQGLAADRAWMPDFPGISDAKHQSEWDPGLPLKLERVREKDERYWDDHRGTPKAFLAPAAGRELWSTRWGSVTALRIPEAAAREAALTATVRGALRPEMNQMLVRDLRAGAAASAHATVDFGGLFLGMSFFLIVAALGLVAMLFQLSLLQRNREDALLGAVGVAGRTLLRWRLREALVILAAGLLLGLPLAMLYSRGILRFLETIWAGQGAGATFAFAARPLSLGIGAGAFLVCSGFAVWLAIRRLARRALSVRLAAQKEEIAAPAGAAKRNGWIALGAILVAAGALGASGRGLPAQAAFYVAGFALLVAGLALCRYWLMRPGPAAETGTLDALHLGKLNLRTRRTRGLVVVGLIATAVFMVLSVASFRKHVGAEWRDRHSGTGGFAFWVETTAAQNLARDGRATAGFEIFESQAAALSQIVPLRAGAGDNANCFNLNTTAQPRLLAVDSAKLAARDAFRVKLGAPAAGASGWNALAAPPAAEAGGAIPGLVDETTLLWALKRKVGDVLTYADESGRDFTVRIVGTLPDSIFQGYLVVDEKRFVARFPSHPGYSIFLLETTGTPDLEPLRARLQAAVADVGGRVDTTRDLLAAFHQIENTYIAIFNVLGSLGVVLGSLGLAIVIARNLRERRGEFAVMTAIGIPRRVLARMVWSEFGRLVLWGVAVGAIASALAVWPNLTSLPAGPTLLLVTGLLAGIVTLNLVSGWLIFRWSLRDVKPGVE